MAEALPCRGLLSERTTEIDQGRRNCDVIADLKFVPPLPYIITVIRGYITAERRGKYGLSDGETKIIALDKHISPLETHQPRLAGAKAADGLWAAVSGAVDAPAQAQGGKPTTMQRLPESAQSEGIGFGIDVVIDCAMG